MRQWVTVHVEFEEEWDIDFTKAGGVNLVPPTIESVTVYGPFETKAQAEKDAKTLYRMVEGDKQKNHISVQEIAEVEEPLEAALG